MDSQKYDVNSWLIEKKKKRLPLEKLACLKVMQR